jgi:hypothetical protein
VMLLQPGTSIQVAGAHRLPDYAKSYANTWATLFASPPPQQLLADTVTELQANALYVCFMHDASLYALPRSAFTTIVQARVCPSVKDVEDAAMTLTTVKNGAVEDDDDDENRGTMYRRTNEGCDCGDCSPGEDKEEEYEATDRKDAYTTTSSSSSSSSDDMSDDEFHSFILVIVFV